MKKKWLVVGIGVPGLLLTSCIYIPVHDPYPGGVAIQAQGEELVVAVCHDIDLSSGLFERNNIDKGEKWAPFWTFSATMHLKVGDVLSTDEAVTPPIAGESRTWTPAVPGDGIEVLIIGEPTNLHDVFRVPSTGLPDDAWLQGDGTETSDPCPAS